MTTPDQESQLEHETISDDTSTTPEDTPVFPHGTDGDPDIPNSGGQAEGHYAEGSQLPAHLAAPDVESDTQATLESGQRRLLAEKSSNVDQDDRPHFQRLMEGQDPVCGQCGRPFPCPTYLQITEGRTNEAPAMLAESARRLELVAEMFGLPIELVRERLTEHRR